MADTPTQTPDLLPGERVLWTGSPARFPVFTSADLVLVPFSLLWTGSLLHWLVTLDRSGPKGGFLVLASLFLPAGAYLLVGRLVVRRLRLRSTVYAVTDRRLVVLGRRFGVRREVSTYLRDLPPPVLGGDGPVASIRFGGTGPLGGITAGLNDLGAWGGRSARGAPVLVEVRDARHVRDTIAAAQAAL